jgi:type IV secretory pathway TrbF-like protein
MDSLHNPYLAARREWDERYGDLITRAKNWRLMAIYCSLIALVATAGIVGYRRGHCSIRLFWSIT